MASRRAQRLQGPIPLDFGAFVKNVGGEDGQDDVEHVGRSACVLDDDDE
jgi:hypothetical protein